MDTLTFLSALVLGRRRGTPQSNLAREAGLAPALLERLAAGQDDPRRLPTLTRRLDITLEVGRAA